ncbi:MAG TPA: CvpA family protein [Roseiflexaceae bacterium]|nr:CvpA family protein [Roseiflexaceae bacterium]
MNMIDLALIVIILLSGILGFYWGIIRQIISLVGVIAGIVVAGRYGGEVAIALSSFISDQSLAAIIGVIAVLVVSSLAGLIGTAVHNLAGLLFLGWLDHLLGVLIGVLQGALAGAALIIFASIVPNPEWNSMLRQSQVAPLVLNIVGPLVLPLLPDIFRIVDWRGSIYSMREFW